MSEDMKMLSCKCNAVSHSSMSSLKQENDKKETAMENIATGMQCDCNGNKYDKIELSFSGEIPPGEITSFAFPGGASFTSFFPKKAMGVMRDRMNRMMETMESWF